MKKYLAIIPFVVAAILISVFIGLSLTTQPAEAPPSTEPTTGPAVEQVQYFTNPVAPGADPFVLKDDDGTYYLYATNGSEYGYHVYSSRNLVEWTAHGFCLVRDSVYTDPNSSYNSYSFWAPEVLKYNGKYYMIYTAQHRLGVAVSDSPTGPFTSKAKSYLINGVNTIDGDFFVDDDGTVYLYFATQGAAKFGTDRVVRGNNIWGCEFDMETLTIKADTISLLVQWDSTIETLANSGGDCVEGPFMIKNNGVYYLTFSSNRYQNTKYSVQYATGDKPLGAFRRDKKNITLMCDDLDYSDNENPHLYGTGHHSFVEAPNGRDLLIVYHAHRTGNSSANATDLVGARSTCIDLAWFDEDGRLLAGSKEKATVPTAVAQPLLEGTKLERQTKLEGAFAQLESLPTVYVAQKDGLDTNAGTKKAPLRTLDRAFEMLTQGGTVVLTQSYNGNPLITVPQGTAPIMITAEHNNVILTYKFIKICRPVYMENLMLAPATVNGISVIECNYNDVVMGEGVSCLNRLGKEYAYLVGGRWRYTGGDTSAVYTQNFRPGDAEMTSDKAYATKVLGGTWQKVFAGSAKQVTTVPNSGENASLTLGEKAKVIN